MIKKIVYKIENVARIYSGGDKPECCSNEKNDEFSVPIYSNGLENEGLYGYTNKAQIEGDCITVSARGVNIGTVFYRQQPFLPIVRLLSVIPDRSKINPKYLYYYFKTDKIIGTGSAQPQITIPFFSKKKIYVFENIETQKKIASVLSAYDNLIENNNKRVKILEQMAENLYKEWFVRFRFPGHETTPIENGIPKGWKKGILSEICCFLRGKNITSSEMVEGPYPVIAAGLEPSGYHNEANVNGVSITISNSGANAGYISIHYSDIWAADCSYVSELKTENIFFVYEMLRNLSSVITNLQRGAAQPHVYAKDVNDLKMYLPPKELMNKANTQFRAIHQQISALTKQNDLLIKQRDLLLPRLMSGKLAV